LFPVKLSGLIIWRGSKVAPAPSRPFRWGGGTAFSSPLLRRGDPCPCGYFGDPNRECRCNAAMSSRVMKAHTALNDHCRDLLENAMHQMNFSARAHDRILKVARTLADLAGHDSITSDHLLEAVNFRTLDRNLWV
jgi:predicted ATPase with chaperone activity